jgi:hypothetical protein
MRPHAKNLRPKHGPVNTGRCAIGSHCLLKFYAL